MNSQTMKTSDEPCEKKPCLDKDLTENLHDNIKNFENFKDIEVINNDTFRKSICLKGKFANKDDIGLVILEKTAFTDTDLITDKYFAAECELTKVFSNDIYGNYRFFPKIELNDIKTTIVYPATEKHIAKYAQQNYYLIDETPEIYNNITLPFINKEQFSLQWAYNILEGKSEVDRIVLQDPDPEIGFVLLPDLKWDGSKETLYLLAVVRKHNIKSLRDVKGEHIPLLKNILKKSLEVIQEKYDIPSSQLRIYFHYQPSFYHLHIHFCYLRHDPPGIYAEKAHMLSNVISNLELLPDYYQKITIPFVVKESENLFKAFLGKGILKKIEKVTKV